MNGPRRLIDCRDCGRSRLHCGRGLCDSCYQRHNKRGTLERYPRLTHRIRDLAEDYDFLARQGYTRALAAERLGVPKKTLEKALERAARMGQVAS